MPYRLDSGILLRLVDEDDSQHALVENVIGMLGNRRESIVVTTQNIAEFWNVATRPIANNGLALAPAKVVQLYENTIEPNCAVLTEAESLPNEFKRLLATYNVAGKQVHDARLVAMMLTWQVDKTLTLNERNFRRFEPEGISVVTPAALLATPS
jgi:predicted nucleic acid-binding protein